ncbi:MAG: hypothetical protein JWN46_2356 [Acidimicrobiales bacterium]|nr:hypothetical protein [Acidimicrobiales bacterium]
MTRCMRVDLATGETARRSSIGHATISMSRRIVEPAHAIGDHGRRIVAAVAGRCCQRERDCYQAHEPTVHRPIVPRHLSPLPGPGATSTASPEQQAASARVRRRRSRARRQGCQCGQSSSGQACGSCCVDGWMRGGLAHRTRTHDRPRRLVRSDSASRRDGSGSSWKSAGFAVRRRRSRRLVLRLHQPCPVRYRPWPLVDITLPISCWLGQRPRIAADSAGRSRRFGDRVQQDLRRAAANRHSPCLARRSWRSRHRDLTLR